VFVDRDGDGRRGDGEEAVPFAVVGAGIMEATTDAGGHAHLEVPVGERVWARSFDGFAVPGPSSPAPAMGAVALGLRPQPAPVGPWRFVVAADAHVQRPGEPLGAEGDLETAVAQATAGVTPPRFVVVAGDLMQNSDPDEAAAVVHVFATSPSPLVAVPGNHDAYDGETLWRARFGPDLWSFDVGGLHVIGLDSMRPVHELTDFVRADLATVSPDLRVIAVTHGPPEVELADVLDGLGVEAVFAGHWHVNRVLHRGAMVEFDTEPWVMGGMDQTPGGYRVVEVERADGPPGLARASLRVRHFTTTELPVVSLVGPVPGQCVAPGQPVPVVVALAGGFDLEPVRAAIDGGDAIELRPAGGWDWIGTLPAIGAGDHTITLRAGRSKRDYPVTGCAAPRFGEAHGSWPQLGGGPERHNAADAALPADLAPRWITAVGGQLGAGSPIVADGLVVVATADLADDQDSAVVALDLASGARRWRFRPGAAVRNAVAAADGVVVAAASDGVVYGLALASGDVSWRVDLGAGVLPEHRAIWGAPLVAGGVAFVGNQRRFAALDLRTGAIRWQVDPVPDTDGGGSFASATLAGGVVVTIMNRLLSGVQGWDPASGREVFQALDVCSLSAAASPVADGARVHVISGAGERCTVAIPSGDASGWGPLDHQSFEWAYSVAATPAWAHDTLLAVTQYGEAFAFDTRDQHLAWARPVGARAAIHAAHYRAGTASIAASPVIAGDLGWIGTADGDVIALELATGRERTRLHVGAPILSGLAVAGDSLIVASYDGTVRVYAPAHRASRVWHVVVDAALVIALYGALVILARRRVWKRLKSLRRRVIGRAAA
jgi:outer membrane protein assembly factor BamB